MRFPRPLLIAMAALMAMPIQIADAQILGRLFRSRAATCTDANRNGICDSDEVATVTTRSAPASRYEVVYETATASHASSSNYGPSSSTYGGYRTGERYWTPSDYVAAGKPVPPSMRGPAYTAAGSAESVTAADSAGNCPCGDKCMCVDLTLENNRLVARVSELTKQNERLRNQLSSRGITVPDQFSWQRVTVPKKFAWQQPLPGYPVASR